GSGRLAAKPEWLAHHFSDPDGLWRRSLTATQYTAAGKPSPSCPEATLAGTGLPPGSVSSARPHSDIGAELVVQRHVYFYYRVALSVSGAFQPHTAAISVAVRG